MQRILVTGSSGLIGSHLVGEVERRYPNAYVQQVDLKDSYDCRDFFAHDGRHWDLVIHCAAITGGIEGTMFNGAFQAATNSQLDGAYFEWALRVRPCQIVYISSSCAYPMYLSNGTNQLKETDINLNGPFHDPDMPYGWAKLNGEVMANAVREAGVRCLTIRPFAIYGESQETCRMIPAFVQRVLSDEPELTVWGPGDQASDFVHASDCANAILELVNYEVDGPVNIASGIGATADEVAEMVMDEVGVHKKIVHDLSKPYGPKWRVGDSTLMRKYYTPRVSLREGVARVVAAQR